jgi:putative DNA primase/helicase
MDNFNLHKALEGTPQFEEARRQAMNGSAKWQTFNLTDLGNAERLIHYHGDRLRYCNPWRSWLVWDGKQWVVDKSQTVKQLAREVIRGIYHEAGDGFGEKERKAVAQHAMRSEAENRINAMVSLAQMDCPILPEHLDANPWLLNVENGTLNLRTGELRPHKREDLITKIIPVAYDHEATCPTWEAFLRHILNDQADLIWYVQKAVGYSLTADTREQCLFLCHGVGANGKSTFLDVLRSLLSDYAEQCAFSTFLRQDREVVRNDLAKLREARFVSAIETDEGKRLAESLIKSVTGGDTITARFLFSEYFDFRPTFKIWLAANHKPEIRGTDLAIWRRIRLIPFGVVIPDDKQDGELSAKLKSELPGILHWALLGCHAWQLEGLKPPDIVKAATSQYRTEMDVIGGFLAECCIVKADAQVTAGALLEAYQKWSGDQKMSHQKLRPRLEERGFKRDRSSATGHMVWHGIGLLTTPGEES